jgi:hypothetical protein
MRHDVAVLGYFPSLKSIIKYPCPTSPKLNILKKIPRVLKELGKKFTFAGVNNVTLFNFLTLWRMYKIVRLDK